MKGCFPVKIKKFSVKPFIKGLQGSRGQSPIVATAVAKHPKKSATSGALF